jgi:hypothetical protein
MACMLVKIAFAVKLVANATLTSAHAAFSKLDEHKDVIKS